MCKCCEDPHSARNLMISFKTVAASRDYRYRKRAWYETWVPYWLSPSWRAGAGSRTPPRRWSRSRCPRLWARPPGASGAPSPAFPGLQTCTVFERSLQSVSLKLHFILKRHFLMTYKLFPAYCILRCQNCTGSRLQKLEFKFWKMITTIKRALQSGSGNYHKIKL